MRRTFLTVMLAALCAVGCNEEEGTSSSDGVLTITGDDGAVTITGIEGRSSSDLESYTVSSFSNHIYFHNSLERILVDYDFFPEDSDVCSQATYDAETNPNGCQVDETIVIPCEFREEIEDDLLSVNVSAANDDEDCEDIVLGLSDAEFTVDGLVFEGHVTAFEDEFGFSISTAGFIESEGGTTLSFDSTDVALEDVYVEVLSR